MAHLPLWPGPPHSASLGCGSVLGWTGAWPASSGVMPWCGCTGADRYRCFQGAFSLVLSLELWNGSPHWEQICAEHVRGLQLQHIPSPTLGRAPAQSVPTGGKHLPALNLLSF